MDLAIYIFFFTKNVDSSIQIIINSTSLVQSQLPVGVFTDTQSPTSLKQASDAEKKSHLTVRNLEQDQAHVWGSSWTWPAGQRGSRSGEHVGRRIKTGENT